MRAWASALAALTVASVAGTAPAAAQTADLVSRTALRVCADPANLPFSNEAGEGFENEIAELLAAKLELPLRYEWFPMATGFVRKTLGEKRCDVIVGFAQGHELVLNTNHYYVSGYAIVTRADSPLADVDHLGDERLQGERLGVIAGTPPATHMARKGLIGKAKGYNRMVDRRHESPAQAMVGDLVDGEIAAAVLWGPIAGALAAEADADLVVTPLLKEEGAPRMFYRITMGVRQGELKWKRKLNSLIRRNQAEIDAILREHGVPLLSEMGDSVVEVPAEEGAPG